jgi:dienelactone hydrolase
MSTFHSFSRKARIPLIILAGAMAVSVSHAHKHHPLKSQPAAMEQFLDVVREDAPGLPGFTVYRPADLHGPKNKFPVIAFSNGACAASNDGHLYFLMQVAARGFVIIAYGEPDVSSAPGAQATEDRLKTAIDWATAPRGRGGSQYHNHLDAKRIATMGHSCGGIDAIWTAEHDARVKAAVSLNSGCFPDDSTGGLSGPLAVCRPYLNNLSGPVMFVAGGTGDVAYPNSIASYERTEAVPAVFASHATAGHGGFFGTAPRTVQLQLVQAVVEFLDGTLNGNTEALDFLVGPNNELSQLPNWTVASKGF